MGVIQDAHLRTELCPLSFEDSASVPMSLPVEANMETQVDVRWESTLVVVPSSAVTGITGEAQLRTDVRPVVSQDSAMEPMSFPVLANTETLVYVGWESTSVVARQVVEVAVRWDGSILHLIVGWWTRLC